VTFGTQLFAMRIYHIHCFLQEVFHFQQAYIAGFSHRCFFEQSANCSG